MVELLPLLEIVAFIKEKTSSKFEVGVQSNTRIQCVVLGFL